MDSIFIGTAQETYKNLLQKKDFDLLCVEEVIKNTQGGLILFLSSWKAVRMLPGVTFLGNAEIR